jgi:hypothetical protein
MIEELLLWLWLFLRVSGFVQQAVRLLIFSALIAIVTNVLEGCVQSWGCFGHAHAAPC